MVLRQLVEGGMNHLHIRPLNSFFDICNLLRALVNQQNQQLHVRMVPGHGLGHILQKSGFTSLGRGHDHASLPLSDGGNQIDDPHGGASARALQMDPPVRENRSQILEIPSSGRLLRAQSVDSL